MKDTQAARLIELIGRQVEKAAQIMDDDAQPAVRRDAERRRHASATRQLTEIQAVLDGKRAFALIGTAGRRAGT